MNNKIPKKIIGVRESVEDASGSKNRFQRERPCQTVEDGRSLVPKYGKTSASENFVIVRVLPSVEVRLRRTYLL